MARPAKKAKGNSSSKAGRSGKQSGPPSARHIKSTPTPSTAKSKPAEAKPRARGKAGATRRRPSSSGELTPARIAGMIQRPNVTVPPVPTILLEGDYPLVGTLSQPAMLPPSAVEEAAAMRVGAPAPLPGSMRSWGIQGSQAVFLVACDPHCLHASWDFTAEQWNSCLDRSPDRHLILQIRHENLKAPPVLEVRMQANPEQLFVPVDQAGLSYLAELGWLSSEGQWTAIATSGPATTPEEFGEVEPEVSLDAQPAPPHQPTEAGAVPEGFPAQVFVSPEAALQDLPVLTVEAMPLMIITDSGPSMPVLVEPLDQAPTGEASPPPDDTIKPSSVLISPIADQGASSDQPATAAQVTSRDQETAESERGNDLAVEAALATGSQEDIPPSQTPIAQPPMAHAQATSTAAKPLCNAPETEGTLSGRSPMAAPAGQPIPASMPLHRSGREFGQGLSSWSGAGPVTKVPAPAGGESGVAGQRPGFWFNVHAELVIYGATEPDAVVSVAGQTITLRPDGTFSCRLVLPDGQFVIPVTAKSAHTGEQRSANLAIQRQTDYRTSP
jgi:hypothetical protein